MLLVICRTEVAGEHCSVILLDSLRSRSERKKGSSFATNVTAVKGGVITPYTENKTKSFSTHNCLFCLQSCHTVDKCPQFKMKGTGYFFGLPESRPHKQRLQELLGLQCVPAKAPRSPSYRAVGERNNLTATPTVCEPSKCFKCNVSDLWPYWGW